VAGKSLTVFNKHHRKRTVEVVSYILTVLTRVFGFGFLVEGGWCIWRCVQTWLGELHDSWAVEFWTSARYFCACVYRVATWLRSPQKCEACTWSPA